VGVVPISASHVIGWQVVLILVGGTWVNGATHIICGGLAIDVQAVLGFMMMIV
jgi:hypothetical protein